MLELARLFPDEKAARKWFEVLFLADRRGVSSALWHRQQPGAEARGDAVSVELLPALLLGSGVPLMRGSPLSAVNLAVGPKGHRLRRTVSNEPEWIVTERRRDRRRLNRILLHGEPSPHDPKRLWCNAEKLGKLWSRRRRPLS